MIIEWITIMYHSKNQFFVIQYLLINFHDIPLFVVLFWYICLSADKLFLVSVCHSVWRTLCEPTKYPGRSLSRVCTPSPCLASSWGACCPLEASSSSSSSSSTPSGHPKPTTCLAFCSWCSSSWWWHVLRPLCCSATSTCVLRWVAYTLILDFSVE